MWTRGGAADVEAGVGTMDQGVESMGKEAMGDEAGEGGRRARWWGGQRGGRGRQGGTT